MKYIALTSANETAMAAATMQLTDAITAKGAQVSVLMGVKTAQEAQAVYREGGEVWRIGYDSTHPELDALIDRDISDSTPALLAEETHQALDKFLNKTAVAA